MARSVATKQSHEINELENIRLLRFSRNDHFGTFYELSKMKIS